MCAHEPVWDRSHLEAEIKERGITLPKAYSKMYKEDWDRLKDLLKIHEFKRLAENNLVTNLSGWKQVAAIVPESQEM